MLTMMMALAAAASDPALPACKAALAKKAGAQIATIEIGSVRLTSRGRTIEGKLTAFQGMAPPAPGSASARHRRGTRESTMSSKPAGGSRRSFRKDGIRAPVNIGRKIRRMRLERAERI